MTSALVLFFQGVCAAAAWTIGLVFLRFWRETSDRLFALFALGFWLLSASWTLLVITSTSDESRPYIYGIRLIAFLLIIVGIIDKNRARDGGRHHIPG